MDIDAHAFESGKSFGNDFRPDGLQITMVTVLIPRNAANIDSSQYRHAGQHLVFITLSAADDAPPELI